MDDPRAEMALLGPHTPHKQTDIQSSRSPLGVCDGSVSSQNACLYGCNRNTARRLEKITCQVSDYLIGTKVRATGITIGFEGANIDCIVSPAGTFVLWVCLLVEGLAFAGIYGLTGRDVVYHGRTRAIYIVVFITGVATVYNDRS